MISGILKENKRAYKYAKSYRSEQILSIINKIKEVDRLKLARTVQLPSIVS